MSRSRITLAAAVIGGMLSIGLSALPAQAAGLTDAQIQAITSLLSSFGADASTISNVNAVLHGQATQSGGGESGGSGEHGGTGLGMGTTTAPGLSVPCPQFRHTLGRGSDDDSTGGEVSDLQDMLHNEGFFNGSTTGFFGPLTEKAVEEFQQQNNVTNGPGLGVVGPLTRGELGKHCGEGHGSPETGSSTPSTENASSTDQ